MEAVSFGACVIQPRVMPSGIAVGRRKKFECLVHPAFNGNPPEVIADLIFRDCGLASWGWKQDHIRVRLVDVAASGFTWEAERV